MCIFALLQPSLLDMAPGRPPDLPKLSRPRFSQLFDDFWHDFLTHFWRRCLQNVLAHFSGNSVMQPVAENLHLDFSQHVCRSCPITLPRYADLDSSSTIVKTRGAGGDSRSVFNMNININVKMNININVEI